MAKPQLVIRYCPKCRWLLRASWISQELLTSFELYVDGVLLGPAEAGVFTVAVAGDAEPLWCRKRDGGFPELKVLKQRVRDRIAPGLDLGHSERRD
jgi:selenoprotein W-related protein